MPKSTGTELLEQLIAAFIRAHDSNNAETAPTWDTTGALKRTFFEAVGKWLPAQDADYASLISEGQVKVGNKTAVSSIAHAQALASSSVTRHTVLQPAPLIYEPPLMGPDAPAEMPAELKDAYIVSVPALTRVDRAMALDAVKGISIDTTRQDMLAAANHSGLALLKMMSDWLKAAENNTTYDGVLALH